MPSNHSLFQFQAERILRLSRLTGAPHVPWYVMTSEFTRRGTEDFLKLHNNFGLPAADVMLFDQGSLPCVDFDGKILLESATKVARAPDGNGGIYSGAPARCQARRACASDPQAA
jgi:UDP-N-acetylglucosamine/UDP-N-acetylgalactosamine diphosphorylase